MAPHRILELTESHYNIINNIIDKISTTYRCYRQGLEMLNEDLRNNKPEFDYEPLLAKIVEKARKIRAVTEIVTAFFENHANEIITAESVVNWSVVDQRKFAKKIFDEINGRYVSYRNYANILRWHNMAFEGKSGRECEALLKHIIAETSHRHQTFRTIKEIWVSETANIFRAQQTSDDMWNFPADHVFLRLPVIRRREVRPTIFTVTDVQ